MRVVGLTSRTSADGVGAALVDVEWSAGRLMVTTRAFYLSLMRRVVEARHAEASS